MNTPNEIQDLSHADCFDPFPEPQTVPSGWDLSELLSSPQPAPVEQADDSAESESH